LHLTVDSHGTALHGTALHGTVLYGTVLCGTVLYGTVLCGTVMYGTVLYGTVLYGTAGQNMGAVPLRGMHTADGKQLLLFRSQTVSDAGRKNSSFSTLAATGHVKHFCKCLLLVTVAMATGHVKHLCECLLSVAVANVA
jgi:uncharacterized protein YjbI with pentapeptide repeats